jgi:hypothetical protein
MNLAAGSKQADLGEFKTWIAQMALRHAFTGSGGGRLG